MKKKSVIITAVIFASIMAALIGIFFGMRSRIGGRNIPTGNEIVLYGITDMISGDVGESIEGLFISLPKGINIEDIMSLSSDPEIAYIDMDRNSDDGRTYTAKVIMKSPGIVRLSVSTTDGKYVSRELTINVVGDETEITTQETEQLHGYVYVTPSGKRYHLVKSCAGDTAISIELENAVENGYTPCKSCAINKK